MANNLYFRYDGVENMKHTIIKAEMGKLKAQSHILHKKGKILGKHVT